MIEELTKNPFSNLALALLLWFFLPLPAFACFCQHSNQGTVDTGPNSGVTEEVSDAEDGCTKKRDCCDHSSSSPLDRSFYNCSTVVPVSPSVHALNSRSVDGSSHVQFLFERLSLQNLHSVSGSSGLLSSTGPVSDASLPSFDTPSTHLLISTFLL